MSGIITRSDGVRYRRAGEFGRWDSWAKHASWDNTDGPNGTTLMALERKEDHEDPRPKYPAGCFPNGGIVLEELPWIPHYPGPRREQYLTLNPHTLVRQGDVVCVTFDTAGSLTFRLFIAPVGFRLGDFLKQNKTARTAWLVSRSDPKEDA